MQSQFSIKLKRKAKKYFSQGLLVKEKENQMQNFKTAVLVFRTQKVIFGDKSLGDHSSTVMRISLRALLTKTTFTEAWCKKISDSVFVVPGTNELNK